ncbi:MAG: hypothetical protein AAFY88_06135 [Acidobacteriota bacterium]
MTTRQFSLWIPVVVALVMWAGAAWPQDDSGLPDRAALEQRLETWSAEAEALLGPEAPETQAAAEAAEAVELLKAQLDAEARAAAVDEAAAAAALELEEGPSSSLGAPPPYDFAVLDGVLDRREVEGEAERLANEAVDAAVRELEAADAAVRDAAAEGVDSWAHRAATARSELARRQLQSARKVQETARCRYDLAKQVASFVSDRLAADPSGLDEKLAQIEQARMVAETRGQQLQREIELAESRWQDARERLEASDSSAAQAEKGARRMALDVADRAQWRHLARLHRLDLEADMWRHFPRRRRRGPGRADPQPG